MRGLLTAGLLALLLGPVPAAAAQTKIYHKKFFNKSKKKSPPNLKQRFEPLPVRFAVEPNHELDTCVTVRGNGGKALSTFHSLARLMEHYGAFDLIHGSSSGSVVAFIFESVMINRAIRKCGEEVCSREEQGRRAALALKSIMGYVDFLKSTPEADTIRGLQRILRRLKEDSLLENVLSASHPQAGYLILKALNTDLGSLVNPEIEEGLINPLHTTRTIGWIKQWLAGAGKWQTDSMDFFFLPSLLSFSQGAELFNRMANFYAGYSPMDPKLWEKFFTSCVPHSAGKLWSEIAVAPMPGQGVDPKSDLPVTCGSYFSEVMLAPYRARMLYQEEILKNLKQGRMFEGVGAFFPAVVSTSAGQGETYRQFVLEEKLFKAGAYYIFDPRMDDIKAGYWGQAPRVSAIIENPLHYPDYKSRNAIYLGPSTWRRAISHSAAEPGLSPILDYSDELAGTFTSGGWFDNHGSLALRNMGCKKIVYVTRAGLDSDFAQGVYRQLNAGDARIQDIFDLSNPQSSMSLTLKESDLIWCTQWDKYEPTSREQMLELIRDGYQALAVTRDDFFRSGANPYPHLVSETQELGCNPQ